MGPLFNEAEQKQRKYEGEVLKQVIGDRIEWYNPVTNDKINDKSKKPTALDIFANDTEEIIHSDVIVADITNNDVGTAKELGISYGLQYARAAIEEIFKDNDPKFLEQLYAALDAKGIKTKRLYAVCSDIRVPDAHNYKGIEIPVGWNQYVIGGIQSVPSVVAANFDIAAKILYNDLNPKPVESADGIEKLEAEIAYDPSKQ